VHVHCQSTMACHGAVPAFPLIVVVASNIPLKDGPDVSNGSQDCFVVVTSCMHFIVRLTTMWLANRKCGSPTTNVGRMWLSIHILVSFTVSQSRKNLAAKV
jgi:hypothetical protein